MKIREILRSKGSDVVTTEAGGDVLAAMRLLVEHDIGSVVVTCRGELCGILSERDVLRLGAADPTLLSTTRVEEAMTRNVIIGTPDDDIDYCMDIMTENRIRHLPILESGELKGIVSIGDVVNAARTDASSENRYLKDYIRGEVR